MVHLKVKCIFFGLGDEYSGEEAFHQIREDVRFMVNEKIWDDIVVLEFRDFELNKFGILSPHINDVSLLYDEGRQLNEKKRY